MALASILNVPEERSWFVQEYLRIGQTQCLIPVYGTPYHICIGVHVRKSPEMKLHWLELGLYFAFTY